MFIGLLSTNENSTLYTSNEKFSKSITFQWFDFNSYKGLYDFVSRTKAIFSFSALVVDLRDVNITAEDLKKAVQMYQQYYSGKLVFVIDSREHHLYDSLLTLQIVGVIDLSRDDFELCIWNCINGNENGVYAQVTSNLFRNSELARELVQLNINLPNHTVYIGVGGCVSKAGATTLAMSIVSALKLANIKACYVDENGQQFNILKEVYSHLELDEDCISINDTAIGTRKPTKDYDIVITDCGSDLLKLEDNHIKILVSYSKPWELPYTATLCQSIEDIHIAFNLAGSEDKDNINKIWGQDVFFLPFVDSVWEQNMELCYWLKKLVEGI